MGQGKARPNPAQTGLRHIQRHRRAHHGALIRRGTVQPVAALIRKVVAKKAPPRHPKTQGRHLRKAGRRRPDRHPLDLSAARRLHQAFQRLRSLRQMDRRQAVQTGHRQKRRRVPRRRPHANARSRQSHPDRPRIRVHGRVRAGLRRQEPAPLSPAAAVAKAQWSRRALQRSMAL